MGLYNYQYFTARFAQEFKRAREFSLPLSIALVRVANFDSVDRARQQSLMEMLVKIVTRNITEMDLLAKYKNLSEVVVVFPLTIAADAEKKMKEILREISQFRISPYSDTNRLLNLFTSVTDYEIGMESHTDVLMTAETRLKKKVAS